MDEQDGRSIDFLKSLYDRTEGNIDAQVSMHDIGVSVGMEKHEAGSLAEELIMQEYVDLKTLAGGIGITTKGVEFLQKKGLVNTSIGTVFKFSEGPILDEQDRLTINELLKEIQKGLSNITCNYETLEAIVVDIKTIEVQLLSSNAKKSIVREIFCSLHTSLCTLKLTEAASKLDGIVG